MMKNRRLFILSVLVFISQFAYAEYDCSYAVELKCGESQWHAASTSNHFDKNNYTTNGCGQTLSYLYNGNDRLFYFTLSSASTVTIELTGLTKDLDLFVFGACTSSGGASFSDCQGISNKNYNANELLTLNLNAGTYYVVVDGYNQSQNSGFDIELNCSSSPSGPSIDCSDALPMQLNVPITSGSPTSNNMIGQNYDLLACAPVILPYTGNDVLYRLDVGLIPKNIEFMLSNLSDDLDLLIFKNCAKVSGEFKLSQCIGIGINTGNKSESIRITSATGTYYIVVDGFNENISSSFRLLASTSNTNPNPDPSYGCSDAIPLSCGSSKWVNAPTTDHFSETDYDMSNCWSNNPADYDGNDHLYRINVGSTPQNIRIKLTGLSKDMDMFLFRSCEDHYGRQKLTNCVAKSIKPGNSSEEISVTGATGTYYLSVDGYNAWQKSGYEISLECTPQQPSYGCSDAIPLTCGSGKWVNAPTTNHLSGTDYNMGNCWSNNPPDYDGNDHLYRINVGSTPQDIRIKLTGLSKDMDMFLFRSCEDHYGSQKLTNCVAKSIKPGNSSEEISVTGATGTYYLSVDGYNAWQKSGYEISLECTPQQPSFGCSDAIPLTCGSSKWVNAPTTDHFSETDYDMSNCWSNNPADYDGNDHLYRINVGSTPQNIRIKITGLSKDMDMFLFRNCEDHYGRQKLTNCVAKSIKSGNSSEEISVTGATGTYYLSVDGYNAWQKSGYEISLECTPQQPSYGCSDAIPLTCGSSKWVNAPTTNHISGTDYNMSNCWSNNPATYDGKDHLYRINVGSTPQDIRIRMTGLSKDMDMFLFRSCEDHYGRQKLTNCVAKSIKPGNSSEEITLTAATGTYYLSVDGYNAWMNSGYEISLSCENPYPEPSCSDIPDIECGKRVVASTASSDARSSDRINSHSACQYSSGYTGREVVFRISGGSAGKHNVTVDLNNLSSGTNLDLFVYSACVMNGNAYSNNWSYQFSNIIECSQNTGNKPESIFIAYIPPHAEYYIVVDTRVSSGWANDNSQFELVISCGDICDQSIETIECGSTISSTTSDRSNDASFYQCESSTSAGNNWGPEKTYKLLLEETSEITIDLNVSANADLNLYVLQSCSINSCRAFSKNIGKGKNESITKILTRGTYYIVVDGYQGSKGSFDLTVSGCGCTYAQELHCGDNVNGTTIGASNRLKSVKNDCFISSNALVLNGGDQDYSFKATESRDYTFNLSGFTKNLDLFVLDDCKDTNACRGFSTKMDLAVESITISLDKNEEIYIVVDSRLSSWGSAYTLSVICEDPTPEPPSCFELVGTSDESFTIDVSDLISGPCGSNSVVTAYPVVDPSTGEINDTAGIELPILGDTLAIFESSATSSAQYFLICYSSLCENEPFVCCKSVTIKPVLSCGDSYSGTTIGGQSSFAKSDIDDCFTSGYNFKGPDELIKFVKEDSSDILQITFSHSTSNLSLFIFDDQLEPAHLGCKGSNFNSTKRVNSASPVGEIYTDEENPLPAGVYYALIEGYDTHIASDFTLSIGCGLSCETALPVTCDVLKAESTLGQVDNHSIYRLSDDLSVVGYSGGENIYVYHTEFTDSLTIRLDSVNANGDLDVFLLSSCDESTVLAYSIDSGTDQLSVEVDSGSYFIVVDGWNGASGSYDLVIQGCFNPDVATKPVAYVRESIAESQTTAADFDAVVYPNPFYDELSFMIYSDQNTAALLSMYSPEGRLLYQEKMQLNKDDNNYFKIDSRHIGDYRGMMFYTIRSGSQLLQGRILRIR